MIEYKSYYPTHLLRTREEIVHWLEEAKKNKADYWVRAFEAQLRRWDAQNESR